MKYIHLPSDDGIQFDRYSAYIKNHLELFPPELRSLVSESRYYDLSSVETFHDAQIQRIILSELEPDRAKSIPSSLQVEISLRGAYRMIELKYTGVIRYRIKGENNVGYFDSFHSDLYTHEFRYESGQYIHEMEFVTATSIEIAFSKLEFSHREYP